MNQVGMSCEVYRGGTSRGFFFFKDRKGLAIANDNASEIDLEDMRVPFSQNNIYDNYLTETNGLRFDIVNQIYNKKIIYDSIAKNIDTSQW